MKPWKWIGLAVFAIVLAFGRWLPNPIPFLGFLYGIVFSANLLLLLFRYLKDRFFWRVRNRLIGSFIFAGVIPLLILLSAVAPVCIFAAWAIGMAMPPFDQTG